MARRAGRRRTDVLVAAAVTIAERGADATRFADVAERSGVPISSLQYYFGSRDDLLVATFRHASESELAELESRLAEIEGAWEKVSFVVDDALTGYREEDGTAGRLWLEAWRFGLRDEEMRTHVQADYAVWERLLSDALEAGVAAGEFVADLDARDVAAATLALIDGIGLRLLLGDPAVSLERAREVVLTALRGWLGLSS